MRCDACSICKRLKRRLPAPESEVCTRVPAFSRLYTSGRIREGDSQESPFCLAVLWPSTLSTSTPHWGKPNEEAKDLAQDFFVRLIEKNLLDRFDPAKARLRTYLRVCVDGLVMNTDKAAQRQKRGGDVAILPLDFATAEVELLELPIGGPGGPEEFFAKNKSLHFQLLELYDIDEGGKQLTYEEVARRFGIKPTDVTNYLAYARREFRRMVLEELRAMTGSDDEFRREAQTLLGVRLP